MALRPSGSRLGLQPLGPEELDAVTAHARDRPLGLQLAQDPAGHLPARAHQAGQVRPGEDGRLAEEQAPMPGEDSQDAAAGVLVEEAFD